MKTFYWFRRDLRLEDNHGLYKALSENIAVIPVFIFDSNILNELSDNDTRVSFIYDKLLDLNNKLNEYNTHLSCFYGTPEEVWGKLISDYSQIKVYCNEDYEPYAIQRDEKVKSQIELSGGEFFKYHDHVIMHPKMVLKENGEPYSVFTPYMRKWKTLFSSMVLPDYNICKFVDRFDKSEWGKFLSFGDIGFKKTSYKVSNAYVDDEIINNYHLTRDFPAKEGTSRIGVHLRFGTISIRKLVKKAALLNEKYLNELIWREFYQMILFYYPNTVREPYKEKYKNIPWRTNTKDFERWCTGETGIPFVDAGMRELVQTGFMHNRLRMITAGFLTRNLLIDWKWGEAFFAKHLMDYEQASNVGGWQWAAGCGCDAAPYFRVFNPESQQKKFDKEMEYVKRFVPDYNSDSYPKPMVNLKESRAASIQIFKEVISL